MSRAGSAVPENSENITTPALLTTEQVGKKCQEHIDAYRKTRRQAVDRANAIQQISAALSSSTPPLTESEHDDSVNTYVEIIFADDKAIERAQNAGGSNAPARSVTADEGGKRSLSPERETAAGKRQKIDENDFPWVVRGEVSEPALCESLRETLRLLKIFAKDPKFTKTSITTSATAPQFPSSEWTNIISGTMVDLDHVISGGFAVANDNREVEVVGGIQFKFGATKAVKQVKNAGDWFIAWGLYTKAAAFVFPHRKEELDLYGTQVLSLFSAASIVDHATIIQYDKAIRARVGDRRNLLLTDRSEFDDLRLYWLNPIGAGFKSMGNSGSGSLGRVSTKSDEPCHRWNNDNCRSKASDCRFRHVCETCGGKHKKTECKSKGSGGA